MVRWLIDSNVLSELRKGERGDPGVRAWFSEANEADLFTSVLVLGEARRGVESIRRRDPGTADVLERWLAQLTEDFGERVLVVDGVVADRWGLLNVPNPVPVVDGLLAATALTHDMVLVTRNVKDVERTGVRVLNPFAQ